MIIKMVYVPDIDGRVYALLLNKNKTKFILFEEREIIKIYQFLLVRNRSMADKIGALLDQVGEEYGVNPNMKK